MFNATPETPPAATAEVPSTGAAGPLPDSGNYASPPQLDGTISTEQRAAVEGNVKNATRSSGRLRGTLVGLAFGGVLGGVLGLLTRRHAMLKTGLGAFAGAAGGMFLSNATWNQKPDVEAPPAEGQVQVPPATFSHSEKIAASRALADTGRERA